MKCRTYKISFDLYVDGKWIEDGLNAKTLAIRIKEACAGMFCAYATNTEVYGKNVRVRVK